MLYVNFWDEKLQVVFLFLFFLLFYFTICSCLFIDGTNKDVEDAVVKFREDGCQPTSKVCRIYGNVCTGFRLLTSVFQNRTEPNLIYVSYVRGQK